MDDGSERSGLSRRQMIRASAVAGAAAWTAPVILDSLSSPAAAVTVGGCHSIAVAVGSCTVTALDQTSTCVFPASYNSGSCPQEAAGGSLSTWCITASPCTTTGAQTFTIGAGCPTCTFVSGQGTGGNGASNNSCSAGALSAANKVVTIPGGTGTFKQFRLVVTCT